MPKKQTPLQMLISRAKRLFQNKTYQLIPVYWAMVQVTYSIKWPGINEEETIIDRYFKYNYYDF